MTVAGFRGSASGLDLALNMGMKSLKGRSMSCHLPSCVSKLLQKTCKLRLTVHPKDHGHQAMCQTGHSQKL